MPGEEVAGRGALVAVVRPDEDRSFRPTEISMMQAPDFGNLHDRALLGPLDGPLVGRILVEREVSASAMIVHEVAGQDAAQVSLAENEDVVQTLATD